jgi:hypothetical protein
METLAKEKAYWTSETARKVEEKAAESHVRSQRLLESTVPGPG